MMTMYKKLILLFLWGFLLSCDSTDLPPEHPAGTITGNVVDGIINGAQVSVYTFDNNRRVRLGSTLTNEQGEYSVEVRSRSRPVLIEVTGGTYKEQASDTEVALSEGQTLRAVAYYETQQPHHVVVTPLTHLAAGLAQFHLDNGRSAAQAVDDANQATDDFFAINTQNVQPLDITDQNNAQSNLNEEALYGFYLAGLSNWTAWANTKNQVLPHSVYTSIGFSQIAYNDIRADGILDGMGRNKAGTDLMPLAVGVVPLDADAYRVAFSLHMLAIANSNENQTGLQVDDLQPAAEVIASRTGALLGAQEPFNLSKQIPVISLAQDVDGYYSGEFDVNVEIGGFLGAERIEVAIDNVKTADIEDPLNLLKIDTTPHTDGVHDIDLTAFDILGNQAFIRFSARFDNTDPVVNVTSPPATKETTALIGGTYSDNAAGVQSISILDQQATLLDDGTWTALVAISPGKNTLALNVLDLAGNQQVTETTVYLDNIPPVIDSTESHSVARFSNGDGSFFELALQDNNNATPVFLETDQLDLTGVSINRQELNNNIIPFFAFEVSDLMGPDAITAFDDISVQLQYEKNGEVVSAFRGIPAVGEEYLVPLVSEMLASDWHQTSYVDEHLVRIAVSDSVGNISEATFTFSADIYVPETFTANANIDVQDINNDVFNDTNFEDRAVLNNLEFASNSYTFTNTTSKAFYIRPADSSLHNVEQRVDQVVREHLVQKQTSTEWQVGYMTPSNTTQCPDTTVMTPTTRVYNWTGNAWRAELVPTPVLGDPEAILSDNLPAGESPTPWTDVPHFDQEFAQVSIKISQTNLDYQYDYIDISDLGNPAASAAYVSNWQREIKNTNPPILNCPDKRYFQQRQSFAYQSVAGYPKGVLSEVVIPTPQFSATGFSVYNNDTETAIAAVDGWYRIPVDQSVTITKRVTTPALTLNNDNVSDVASFPSYTPNWNDKSITWQVNRNMEIILRHDAGETNIPNMRDRDITTGADAVSYQISR